MNHKSFIAITFATALNACTPTAKTHVTPQPKPPPTAQTAPPPQPPITKAPNISGQYTEEHFVHYGLDGDDVEGMVTNCIALEQNGATLNFSLILFFENDYTCTMQGKTATQQADGTFLYSEDLEKLGHCRLSITVDNESISLKDKDNICRKSYCEQHGALDGSRVSRAQHDPNTLTCKAED